MKIKALVIVSDDNVDFYICRDTKIATQILSHWVSEKWETRSMEKLPDSPDTAIEEYFKAAEDSEFPEAFSIKELEILESASGDVLNRLSQNWL